MLRHLVLVVRDEGQDIIEYALLGAFISVIAIVTIQAIGPLLTPLYESIQDALSP